MLWTRQAVFILSFLWLVLRHPSSTSLNPWWLNTHLSPNQLKHKMVGVLGRSVSFTNIIPTPPKKPTRHSRSASLPCSLKSHPSIKDDIEGLKSEFGSSKTGVITTTCLLNGLTRLCTLHDSLQDFLLHSFRAHPEDDLVLEKALSDVLKYVDAYGMFQQSLMAMKAAQQAAFLKMRKQMICGQACDVQQLHGYELATKKMNREMSKLVSMCRLQSGNRVDLTHFDEDDEIGEIIRDACDVTAMVSITVFAVLISSGSGRGKWKRMALWTGEERKKSCSHVDVGTIITEEFKLGDSSSQERMVEVMDRIEVCSASVFRSLINTRVSLLNLLTQVGPLVSSLQVFLTRLSISEDGPELQSVASQAFGGARPAVQNTHPAGIAELQSQSNRSSNTNDDVSQINVQRVAQNMACGDAPSTIFQGLIENAVQLCNTGNGDLQLVEDQCNDSDLTDEFMAMLRRDVSRRVEDQSTR